MEKSYAVAHLYSKTLTALTTIQDVCMDSSEKNDMQSLLRSSHEILDMVFKDMNLAAGEHNAINVHFEALSAEDLRNLAQVELNETGSQVMEYSEVEAELDIAKDIQEAYDKKIALIREKYPNCSNAELEEKLEFFEEQMRLEDEE